MWTIRDAGADDLPRILAITNQAIAETTTLWAITPETIEKRRAWLEARWAMHLPVLVADRDGAILGFGSFAGFRAGGPAPRAVEHSVYVEPAAQGHGLGRALLTSLIDRARAGGVHVMIGGIDAENQASLNLHARAGFKETGRLREVGRKFDRWLDLVFVQKIL